MVREFRNGDDCAVKAVLQAAFAVRPWYETLSDEEVERRWNSYITRNGFSCLVFETGHRIVGATWWDMPTLEQLEAERGQNVTEFARQAIGKNHLVVWGRDTVVHPDTQGRGIAWQMRCGFLSRLSTGSLVLTRHRDDNWGIIRVSEKAGYKRTGIRVPSSQTPGIFHEYWYFVKP